MYNFVRPSWDWEDALHTAVLAGLWACIGVTSIYAINRWKHLIVSLYLSYLKTESSCQGDNTCADDDDQEVPLEYGAASHKFLRSYNAKALHSVIYRQPVTVQICTFNEGVVAVETITRACHLDWPADLLTVLICDDSTQDASRRIIDETVNKLQQQGHNVLVLRRPKRTGYKAGNLSHHFSSVPSDFIAHLDADHWVEKDWLKLMLPHFFGTDGQLRPKIGCVQAPWAYYNTHTNLLTECDAASLDYHHVVEQPNRSFLYQLFGFNGTGGIWRREAVEAAGGWSPETVTEDLSLSYEAYLAGYRMTYVVDLPQRLELPAGILAYVQQKTRWTKGFFQVLRLTFPKLWRSSTTPLAVKLEAFSHMSAVVQTVSSMGILLLYPYVLYHGLETNAIRWSMAALTVEPILSFFHTVTAKIPIGDYTTFHSRLARCLLIIPFMGLRFGMITFEFKAMLEGLMSADVTFLSTPKDGVPHGPTRESFHSKIEAFRADDVAACAGLFLGVHHLVYVLVYGIQHQQAITYFQVFVRLANIIIVAGLIGVNGSFLWYKYGQTSGWRKYISFRGSPLSVQMGKRRCWFRVVMVLTLVCNLSLHDILKYLSTLNVDDLQLTGNQYSHVMYQDPWDHSMECPLMSEDLPPRHMPPVVVFSEPRSGSNLFLDLIDLLDRRKKKNSNLCLANFREILAPDRHGEDVLIDAKNLARAEGMAETVHWQAIQDSINASHSDSDIYAIVKQAIPPDTWPSVCRFFQAKKRFSSDTFLAFLSDRVRPRPGCEDANNYFLVKIFNHMVDKAGFESPANFVRAAVDHAELRRGKVFILWRQRVVETFVSHVIAARKQEWIYTTTGAKDQIAIDYKELKSFVSTKRRYYTELRRALEAKGIPYEVFEYDRDLSTTDKQIHTVHRLMESLGQVSVDDDDTVLSNIMQQLDLVKQAQVPVEKQVSNWDQVVQWGFANSTEGWEDLFGMY